MATEYIADKVPLYVHNKHTSYENTVLQEHSSIVSGLKDTATNETLIESQGSLFIGLCMKGNATKFVQEHYEKYYLEEYNKIGTSNNIDRKSVANTRTWLRIINEAMDFFLNKYRVDGSKAKMAVMDDITADGHVIKDVDDIPVDFTDEGE
jgi:hypothetical protein